MTNALTATAHANIALIKYWGKDNAMLNIPTTSSLSMTLDDFYTTTSVEFNPSLDADTLVLDEREADAGRVHRFLDMLRQNIADFPQVLVISSNHVPTSAGLASSSSAFAALTAAMFGLLELPMLGTEMSRIARRGSGSAARSIFGNFALWHKGEDDFSSYAESFLDEDIELSMIVATVSRDEKAVSSTDGMQRAMTSQAYGQWLTDSERQLTDMKAAVLASDIEKIGLIAQANALAMHALNRSCDAPFDYFTDETWALVTFAQKCYREGLLAFATIDAGPNVKIITNHVTELLLLKKFQEAFPEVSFSIAHSGAGVRLDDHD